MSKKRRRRSKIVLSKYERKVAAEMRRMIASQKRERAAKAKAVEKIKRAYAKALKKIRAQRKALKRSEQQAEFIRASKVAKVRGVKPPKKKSKYGPKYYRTREFTKKVKGKNRRFVGVFEHRKGEKDPNGKLISSRRVTEFAVVGDAIPNRGRIWDATDKVAKEIHDLPWPLIVRAVIRGTMGGKQVIMVASIVFRRNNPLYRNKSTKAQKVELVSDFLGAAILRKLRSLAANPSSTAQRKKASKHTKSNKFFDLYADPSRLYIDTITFEVSA